MPYLRVIKPNSLGHQENGIVNTSPSDVVPEGDDLYRYVEVTKRELKEYDTVAKQLRAGGRSEPLVEWDPATGKIQEPAETRPLWRVVVDKTQISADGADTASLTISVLDENGDVDTIYNETRFDEVNGGYLGGNRRWVRHIFVNGVTVKTFKTFLSGPWLTRSNDIFRVENEVTVKSYEVEV